MALKNIEAAIVDRARRAVAKELKELRRRRLGEFVTQLWLSRRHVRRHGHEPVRLTSE